MDKEFDVGFSFAGEDRDFVEMVVKYLKRYGVDVFYDADYDVEMWGNNLTNYLECVYRDKCCFVVVFISKFYVDKPWTGFEFDIIKDRWLKDRGFILPVKLDRTSWKGFSSSISYLDASNMTAEELGNKILLKINKQKTINNLTYSDDALSDVDFSIDKKSEIYDILNGLKIYNYYVQNEAINKLSNIKWSRVSNDECFVLGRNILQSAEGGANDAADFLINIRNRLAGLPLETAQNILSGVAYEIYFNKMAKFRSVIKGRFLKEIADALKVKKYSKSYKFILKALDAKRDCFSTAPLFGNTTIKIVMKLGQRTKICADGDGFYLKDLLFCNRSLFKEVSSDNNFCDELVKTLDDIKKDIWRETGVPASLISFENNGSIENYGKKYVITKKIIAL